jgi:hypothetical protein
MDKYYCLLLKSIIYGHKMFYSTKILKCKSTLVCTFYRLKNPINSNLSKMIGHKHNIRLGWKGLPGTNTRAYYENP